MTRHHLSQYTQYYIQRPKVSVGVFLIDSDAVGVQGGGMREGARGPLLQNLRQNYFIFMETFQKNREKLINNQVKLKIKPPL